jgi:hypothetical protein
VARECNGISLLADLQRQLTDTYQLGAGYDIRDYLITDPRLARAIGGEAMLTNTSETLLVCEDDDGLSLSLFLDSDMLSRLEHANPLDQLRPEQLEDLCKVIEGLSHFNCMVWNASQDRTVSLLELELQAEIDKFVGTMQLAIDQDAATMLHGLHGWLFDNVSYLNELDEAQLARYRAANDYAARFCSGLRRRLIKNGVYTLSELRGFYRMQLYDKISHIHQHAWAAG